jgi:hypothetical protein
MKPADNNLRQVVLNTSDYYGVAVHYLIGWIFQVVLVNVTTVLCVSVCY